MAPRLEGSGATAWSGFHALTVEVAARFQRQL
jgi:hypothetical protein